MPLEPAPDSRWRTPVAGWTDASRRRVIVHYHFFKNAGSSVDAALIGAFGRGWRAVEAARGHELSPDALGDEIRRDGGRIAFASHTARFPVPRIDGASILPVVFLRHPLDRVRSIYEFERRQFPVRTAGALMAKVLPLRAYVRWRFRHDRLIRGFYVDRLGSARGAPATLARATSYLSELPFVGVVEHFEASMRHLERLVRLAYPAAALPAHHKNGRRDRATSLEERLRSTREALGDALYAQVADANADDLALYEAARHRLEVVTKQAAPPSEPRGRSASGIVGCSSAVAPSSATGTARTRQRRP